MPQKAAVEGHGMRRTISDLWLVAHTDRDLDLRAPVFTSHQIDGEVQRANLERRFGRADWVAVDLVEMIIVYGDKRAISALRGEGATRH